MEVFYYKRSIGKNEIVENFRKTALQGKDISRASQRYLEFLKNPNNFTVTPKYYQALSLDCSARCVVDYKTRKELTYVEDYRVNLSDKEGISVSPHYNKTTLTEDHTETLYYDETYFICAECNNASVISSYEACWIDPDDFEERNPYGIDNLFHEISLNKNVIRKFASECVDYDRNDLIYSSTAEIMNSEIRSTEISTHDPYSFNAYIYALYEIKFVYNDIAYSFESDADGFFYDVDFFQIDLKQILDKCKEIEEKCETTIKKFKKDKVRATVAILSAILIAFFTLIRVVWYMFQETSPQENSMIIDHLLFYGILPAVICAILSIVNCAKGITADKAAIEECTAVLQKAKLCILEKKIPEDFSVTFYPSITVGSFFGISIIPIAYVILSYFL
ncbi:MAG: hypothetical protein IJ515_00800 [Clostridia bacterium]|nr:hypothetical protein [Clostridia bacterium]